MGVTRAVCYAAAIALAAPASAQSKAIDFGDGNGLLQICESPEYANQLLCLGFISGLSDGLAAGTYVAQMTRGELIRDEAFCRPAGLTRGQTKDVVVKYLRDHPEERHQPSNMLFWSAVKAAFPCARQK